MSEGSPDAVPPDLLRVSDVDRKAVQDRLHNAHAEGLITLAEFDTRVGEAWQAKTRGELARLTADLPPPRPKAAPASPPVPRRKQGPTALRVLTIIWLSILAVNLVVWGIVAATSSHTPYPWWLWVAGPPGAVLGVLWWTLGPGKAPRELPEAE